MAQNYHDRIAAIIPGAVTVRTERTKVLTIHLPDGTRRCFDRVAEAVAWARTWGKIPEPPTLDPGYLAQIQAYMAKEVDLKPW